MSVTEWAVGAGATAIGGRRANEDSYLTAFPVFVVADGMGGHVAGGEASAAVVSSLSALVGQQIEPTSVVNTIAAAHHAVERVSDTHGGAAGSTLSGVFAVEHHGEKWWHVTNVGDSRVYAWHGGELEQITVDHSRVQELYAAGYITREQMRTHPERNIITRAMGDGETGADSWLVPIIPGMRLVCASDGLFNVVSDIEIARIVSASGAPQDAAQRLVDAALAANTSDNVTVVVVDAVRVRTNPDASAAPWLRWQGVGPIDQDDENTVTSARRAE